MSDADSKILNEQIGELDNEFNTFAKPKKEVCCRYNIDDLFVGWFISVTRKWWKSKMPLIEGDVEKYYSVPSTALSKGVKEGKGLKIVTSNKLLSKVIMLLSQIKPGNNSNQKHVIREIVYLFYQHNKIPNTFYKNLIK